MFVCSCVCLFVCLCERRSWSCQYNWNIEWIIWNSEWLFNDTSMMILAKSCSGATEAWRGEVVWEAGGGGLCSPYQYHYGNNVNQRKNCPFLEVWCSMEASLTILSNSAWKSWRSAFRSSCSSYTYICTWICSVKIPNFEHATLMGTSQKSFANLFHVCS